MTIPLEASNLEDASGNGSQSRKQQMQSSFQLAPETLRNGGDNCETHRSEEFSDEEDDSDWEPNHDVPPVETWFCVICTMPNCSNFYHCSKCGEHIDSSIVKPNGFFSSSFSPSFDSQSRANPKFLNSTTAVGYDERMLLHEEVDIKFSPHVERSDRLRAISASLAAAGIFPGRCCPIPAREITMDELLTIHSLRHVQKVDYTSDTFTTYFTRDTYANKHSAEAARLAAGLCADLTSSILSGRFKNGFALVRPPGHHAGVNDSAGFCLHNNAAIAASTALSTGAKRVLILDWDVHHGNGTQEIFEKNKSVLYISLHRHDGGTFYPFSGSANEVGSEGAEGYCVNIPWNHGGVGDNDYLFAFNCIVLPIAKEFAPDFTIVSAGFDAAAGDPLGGCNVSASGYAKMTTMLSDLSNGKLLVILEGGYNLRSISNCATAVIRVLLDEIVSFDPNDVVPSKSGWKTVSHVLKVQKKYWPSLHPIETLLLNESMTKKKIGKKHPPMWWKWGRKRQLFYAFRHRFSNKLR